MTGRRQRTQPRVGELRPSQLLQTFGVGAVVDLPHLSVIVMGLDDWNTGYAEPVTEERLLAAVRHHLGNQVAGLRTPPYLPETSNPFDEWAQVGVPVAVFPRWLRCPRCNLLAPITSGLFTLKTELVRTDRTRYVHTNCSGRGKAPDVLAARFLLACPAGHLDDFPWVEFVHQGAACSGPVLELREIGVSGLAADVQVRCRTCNTPRRMAQAFGEEALGRLPRCRGRHPHLASFHPDCDQPLRTILLGASNAWFAVRLSVLSIPVAAGPLAQKVAERWADLQRVTSPEVLAFARGEPKYATFAAYSDAELWAAIEARRSADGQAVEDPSDLLGPEWAAFSNPAGAPAGDDFRLRPEAPPPRFTGTVEQVVLAERLREVRALVGFTRVDAPDEPRHGTERMWAQLARTDPLWVPCAEVRGEGVFLRLAEQPLVDWERRVARSDREQAFAEASARWRYDRGLPPAPWPGMRFALLHTLAHVLIREFALECGYGAAGLAERLYAQDTARELMAGLLLYPRHPTRRARSAGWWSSATPNGSASSWIRRSTTRGSAAPTRSVPSTSPAPARCTARPAMPVCLRPRRPARPATVTLTARCWSTPSAPAAWRSSTMAADPLAEAISQTARELPAAQALRLADKVAGCPEPAAAAQAGLYRLVPTAAFERAARRLVQAWGTASGEAVAVGLRAAVRAVQATRADQSIDIVWTGPQTPEVPVRLTRAVLVDVIRSATERLTVVSFAAYRVALVLDELAAAAARGVDIRLVLETAEASGGRLAVDAATAFASLGATVGIWVWPAEQRPVLPAGTAALHAKAAIADDHTALVTSANLTGHAINENMELGLLVRSGPVPRRLAAHFTQLMTDRVLVRVP